MYGGECDYNPFDTFMGPWQNYEMIKPNGIKLKDSNQEEQKPTEEKKIEEKE